MTHKETASHLRRRIKKSGINARCRMYQACGVRFIQVFGVTPEAEFSESEQQEIRLIAQVNGLTWAQGMPIDIEQMTNLKCFDFQYQ